LVSDVHQIFCSFVQQVWSQLSGRNDIILHLEGGFPGAMGQGYLRV
jgi:hypothetical protein